MKVLFIATAFPRYEGDVITPWLVELILRLRQAGTDARVFTSSYRGLKHQVIAGIPVFRFRYFLKRFERLTHEETAVDRLGRGPLNLWLSVCYIVFGALAIYKLTRTEKFDIIHVNWPFPHIIFGIIAKYFGRARLFATFYGLEIRWLKKKFKFLIKPFSLFVNRADVVTAISSHTAQELAHIVKKKVPVIPFSTSTRVKSGAVSDAKEILFAGRAVQRKGVDCLIRAFSLVQKDIPHRLVIVGEGPQRQKWEELAAGIVSPGRFEFTGWISDQALADHYRSCSFFVLPAVYDRHGDTEGLGVVMIEAMSHAKAVIASNVGGITDVVEDGVNGILVPAGNINALAGAIKRLALDKELNQHLGQRAKKVIDEKFNWNKIVERMIALYERHY